jgi:uncharacterized membrane protein
MTALVIGLVLFLGLHSTRMVAVADGARSRFIARRGSGPWRALYSIGSAIGLVLVVWGFGIARRSPVVLWTPPDWTRPLAWALTLVGIVLITAAYVPGNILKARLGHPMVLGIKVWAFGHLVATGTLADLLLFGGFLAWAVWCFGSLRARDRAAGRQPVAGKPLPTGIAVVAGASLWFVFAYWLHGWVIGVSAVG